MSYNDAGSRDQHTVIIDWGDGSAPTVIKPPVGTTQLNNIEHLYRDNSTSGPAYTITVKVADQDMAPGVFTTATTNLQVRNFKPVASPVSLFVRQWRWLVDTSRPRQDINEGDEVRITVATSTRALSIVIPCRFAGQHLLPASNIGHGEC